MFDLLSSKALYLNMHETKSSISFGQNGEGKKEAPDAGRTKAPRATNEARPEVALARPGYIYLVRLARLVKIGRTTTPEMRLRDMMVILPKARLIHLMRVPDMRIERELHFKYRAQRAHGEWFHLNYRDVKAIKQIAPAVPMDHIPLRTPHEKRMDVFRAIMRKREPKAIKGFATVTIAHKGKRQTFRVHRYDAKRFLALGKIQAASTIGKRIALVLEAIL